MATRHDVNQRRATMQEALKAACLNRQLVPGEALAPLRDLAAQYGVSRQVAWQSVQNLVKEGVLYTVPRVGTFVGIPRAAEVDVYLIVLPWLFGPNSFSGQVHSGFEERLAQLGSVCMMFSLEEALELHSKGELPTCKGIFEMGPSALSASFAAANIASACFGSPEEMPKGVDTIHFDDIDGGMQATRHLMAAGHRKIAFLGLHNSENQTGKWQWSAEREAGWRQVVQDAGGDTELVFRPTSTVGEKATHQFKAAFEAAQSLVHRDDVDAVVVANSKAVQGLFEALRRAEVPAERWPAVVGFDDDPMIPGAVVSYLRLPWENIGRRAAELLHERANGKIQGPAQQHLMPMRLIPRLSCRGQWTTGLNRRLSQGYTNLSSVPPGLSGQLTGT